MYHIEYNSRTKDISHLDRCKLLGRVTIFQTKIKNLMRTTMGQTRLTHLATTSLVSSTPRRLDQREAIHEFARAKRRH